MLRVATILAIAMICALAPAHLRAEPISVAVESGAVVGRDAAGMAVWRVQPQDMNRMKVQALPDGRIDLGDGTLLSAQGRVLRRGGADSATELPAAQNSPTWDALTVIDPTVNPDFLAPIFDPLGNAWVVNLDGSGQTVTAIESNGVSGTWQAPQVIMGPGLELVGVPAMSIDRAGVVHVVCRNINSGQYQILYTSHAPGGVWQAPQVIYSSPYFFQSLSVTTDTTGDAIVVFDRSSSATGLPQGWSVVYAHATGSAGTAQMISPPEQSFYLPSLAKSPNGAVVSLVYTGSLGAGLYYQTFNASTLTWQTAQSIPETKAAAATGLGIDAHYPLTVDALGNATLIAPYYTLPMGSDYKLEGLRFQKGSWYSRTTLIPWGPATGDGDILDFGSIAQDQRGDSFAVGTAFTTTAQIINAYRYTSGSGWDVELVAQQSHKYASSSVGIAYFGSSGEAVASYFRGSILKTTMYIAGSWSYSPIVPGPYEFGEDPLATAPNGEVLLTPLSSSGFVAATFLRP